jgi:cbb3-type cytochrome oxidase subunit 3
MNVKLAVKAVTYTVLLMVTAAVFGLLMAWTKGLFALIVVFSLVVWWMYNMLERYDRLKERHGSFDPWKRRKS